MSMGQRRDGETGTGESIPPSHVSSLRISILSEATVLTSRNAAQTRRTISRVEPRSPPLGVPPCLNSGALLLDILARHT